MLLIAFSAAVSAPPHPDALSACAAMNVSMKIELMHGFGEIDGSDARPAPHRPAQARMAGDSPTTRFL